MSYQDTPSLMPINKQEEYQAQPYILREDEKIPLFLIKLWNIVEDPAYYEVIRWDESGYSFHITDPYSFCRNVLPQFFKHNNLNSLIRQLNMYGFRKMTPIERTSLARAESDQDHLEFSHPYFVREHPELLINIKRKVPSSKQPIHHDSPTTVNVPAKDLSMVFEELRQLRDRQKNMEYKMNELVKENELIWQEMDHVRGAHLKQQQIVNKLVQFLVSLVQPNKQQRLGKRQLLAIDEFQAKRSRDSDCGSNASCGSGGTSRIDDIIGGFCNNNNSGSQLSSAPSQINANEVLDTLINELASGGVFNVIPRGTVISTSQGPIIADVTDELDQLHCANNGGGETTFGHHSQHHPKQSQQQRQSPIQGAYPSVRSQRASSVETQQGAQVLRGGGIQPQQQPLRFRANSTTHRHGMASGRGSANVIEANDDDSISRRGSTNQPSTQNSNMLAMNTRRNDGRYRYARQQPFQQIQQQAPTRYIDGGDRILSNLPLQISAQPQPPQLHQEMDGRGVEQTQIVPHNQYSQRSQPVGELSAQQPYQPQYHRVSNVAQPPQQYVVPQSQKIQQQQKHVAEPPQICYTGVISPQQPSPRQQQQRPASVRSRSGGGGGGASTSPVVMTPPSHDSVQNQPQQFGVQNNNNGSEGQAMIRPGKYAALSGTMMVDTVDDPNMMASSLSTPQPTTSASISKQTGGPTITFEDSPRDFNEYLSSMDQSINQCRDNIADHWNFNELIDEIDPQELQELLMDDIGLSENPNSDNGPQYTSLSQQQPPPAVAAQQQPLMSGMEELSPLLNVPVDTPLKRRSDCSAAGK